jgi:hypothetical protein
MTTEGGLMRKRIWTVVAGVVSIAALVAIPAAYAAYTSPKLEVARAGTAVTVKASLDPDDDPTASVRIFVPTGTQLTTTQAPGTALGPVRAIVKALDLAGADLPLAGNLVVAAPGQIAPAAQAACLGTVTPLASWVMVLSAAGQTLPVPAYLVATTGAQAALGPAFIQVCLPPPDIPVGTPGRATFGAKLYSAELTINGVFSASPGAWVAFWTPFVPSAGQVNAAGTVASPAAIGAGAVSVAARKSGAKGVGAVVTGRVTQAGQARAGAAVTIFGGPRANRLKRLGRVSSSASGAFRFRAKAGVFFRANVAAAAAAAPAVCSAIGATIAPVPCVNPTTNGFTVVSRVIRKR